MKELTIVMPFLNEKSEPLKTIESIYSSIPSKDLSKIEIIAIEDSSIPFLRSNLSSFPDVIYIKNRHRLGVDQCRQNGINMATAANIMIIDGHMRFKKDNWFEKIKDCLKKYPKSLWCTSCLVLGYGNMDVYNASDKYYGASILFSNNEGTEILEPKWITESKSGEYEIPVILGANYFFTKQWIEHINGLSGLKMWGTSEPFLSLKSWMSGGSCRITTDIEIGHKFRDVAPYSTKTWCMLYNKIYLCKTILPESLSNILIEKMDKNGNFYRAMDEIKNNNISIEKDKNYYNKIFSVSINDFCKKFNITLPSA